MDTALPESTSVDLPKTARRTHRLAQAIVLAVLYATPVFFVLRMDGVTDTDIWWHLRIGEWIAQHRAIPHTELFSISAAGQPWAAYSWLFEVIAFALLHNLGLIGIVVYSSATVLAIVVALHHLLRRLNADFTIATTITLVAMYTMGRLYTPRPWLLTILFFTLELDIISRVRKGGSTRELIWLPLIFAAWVNIHIQFIDGLVVLGIALAEAIVATRWSAIETNLRAGKMAGVFIACLLATLVNPYGFGIYKVAYDLVAQAASLDQIYELSAISFRHFDDWCVLGYALACTFVLARKRRPEFFELCLLAFAIVVSFRSQRDIWVLAIAGSAIVAANLEAKGDRFVVRLSDVPVVGVGVVVLWAAAFATMRVNNAELQVKLENNLPVEATKTIQQNNWNGPIFNSYNWGGFLIWSLHRPVSMYGRNTDYGVEKVLRSSATWGGDAGWETEPDLVAANLVIAPAEAPLVQVLRFQPCLKPAYQDHVAVVFIARDGDNSSEASTTLCTLREKLRNH